MHDVRHPFRPGHGVGDPQVDPEHPQRGVGTGQLRQLGMPVHPLARLRVAEGVHVDAQPGLAQGTGQLDRMHARTAVDRRWPLPRYQRDLHDHTLDP